MCFTEIKLHHTNLLPPANEVAGRSGADPGFGQGGGQLPSCQCSRAESHEQSELSAARVQGSL